VLHVDRSLALSRLKCYHYMGMDENSRKVYVLWGIAMVLLLAAGLFCWLVVVPVWRVKEAVGRWKQYESDDSRLDLVMPAEIEKLGGSGQAARELALYLWLPDFLAPDKRLAVDLLEACGEAATPALLANLSHRSERVRNAVLWEMRYGGPAARAAVPQLAEIVSGQAPGSASAAALVLCELGPDAAEAVPSLIIALRSDDSELRTKAARALGRIGVHAKSSVPLLMNMLSEKNDDLRSAVITALGEIGPSAADAAPALEKLCATKPDSLDDAALALYRVTGDAEKSIEILVSRLKSSDAMTRTKAVSGLYLLGRPARSAIPVLEKMARNPGPESVFAQAALMKMREHKAKQEKKK
jgi:HEAT repeat protein